MTVSRNNIIYGIIVLSGFCLLILLKTHFTIYNDYTTAKGKNKALFGLRLYLIYGYRYYYGIAPTIGLLVSLYLSFRKGIREIALFAALISLIAILFSFFEIWSFFI